ncbi:hypothetical protein LCGC14_0478120 [marine sediment metagenome]|uniref:Uncharacterized protein n=1 Tax=marine sediment metagenome TaxID=412755 RepID=A0A0F9ST67_9ZZZZ
MPTLTLSFDVPADAVPRLEGLMVQMNEGRIEGEEAPWASVNEMIEAILKNRVKLLILEAERLETSAAQLAVQDATPEQIERIAAILKEE